MQLFLQLVKVGIVTGMLYGLFAYGLSLILAITKIFHVAHGVTFILGVHVYYSLSTTVALPMPIAALITVPVCGVVGALLYALVYRPLHRRGADSMVVLVASLVLLAFAQYLVQLLWGGSILSATTPGWFSWSTTIGGVRVDAYDASVLIASLSVLVGTHWFLNHTHAGLQFRAVGDNPERSSTLAIKLDRVFLHCMIFGSVLMAPAAVLSALNAPIHSTQGFELLIKAVLALTIGGMGRMAGAFAGGLLVGLTEALPPFWLPTEWAQFVLYVVLAIFVLYRPDGLVGLMSAIRGKTRGWRQDPGSQEIVPSVANSAAAAPAEQNLR